MSSPLDGQPGLAPEPEVAPAALSPTRPFYWSVRRELWENRSLHMAPLVAAAVVLFGFSVNAAIHLSNRMAALPTLDAARQQARLATPYNIAASVIILASYLVAVFYCLDTLHGERRDRSILFWKSLPVSDRTTLLAKASIPFAVLPLIAFAVSLATQISMFLISTAVLLASGFGVALHWSRLSFVEMSFQLLYGVAVHAFWHAPLYSWLLLVSAWARRAPFLWAVLPPLALGVVEWLAFRTSFVGRFVRYRVAGAMKEAYQDAKPGASGMDSGALDPLGFLTAPGLWLGLVVAALFLTAAVRLRRRGEPL